MKKCKYCGKELHEDANFCPYCMRKQINAEYVVAKSVHGLRFRWLILAGAVLIAAVFACVWILPKIYQKPDAQQSAKKEDSAIDYHAYVGTWFSKEISSADEFYESGGSAVQIFSIDDRIAEISLSTVQSAPANRAATTDKIYGEVDGNVIQFSFQNDGWMSSGEGTITLLNDTIYAEVIYTYKDPSALWYLDHANIFYLCDKETPSLFG